jgi:catechol 2,3-dioxygenase-like lactoylglutathione lyase family enzyme
MPSRLRQVVLMCRHLEPTLTRFREVLGLDEGIEDPAMARFDLYHKVMTVGAHSYIEICAPLNTDADTTATRFLARNGGDGGYMVVVQVPDAEGLRARVADRGFAIAFAADVGANAITQLHPSDFGTLLEADQIGGPGQWHYPELDDQARTDVVTGIVGAELAVADPASMAARWADVLDAAPEPGATTLTLGPAEVRFIPVDGTRTGLVAFDVKATDLDHAGTSERLGGVDLRFV